MELGGDANALETNPDKPSQVFRWNLAREYDVHVDTSGIRSTSSRSDILNWRARRTSPTSTTPRRASGTRPTDEASFSQRTSATTPSMQRRSYEIVRRY
jgi:hypothetical protein